MHLPHLRRLLLPVLALTCLASAAFAQPALAPGLDRQLDQALAAVPDGVTVGISVRSVPGGEVLYARGETTSLIIASNAKLLTAGAALWALGPYHELRTELYARGRERGGVLHGDLLLVGGGDPFVAGRFHDDHPERLLRSWARQLKAQGIHRIAGDLVLDASVFSGPGFHPDWPAEERYKWYSAPVSALSLNDNCLDIVVGPGGIEVRPPTTALTIDNRLGATTARTAHSLAIWRTAGSSTIHLKGKVWSKAQPTTLYVTVPDPAAFFGDALRQQLVAEGIGVDGVVRPATVEEQGVRKSDRLLLIHSTPLGSALATVGKRSQNLHAELLFRWVGRVVHGEGSFDGGRAGVTRFLTGEVGLTAESFQVADGSGLSRNNRNTADNLARVLLYQLGRPDAEVYLTGLARSGVDGTLKRRMSVLSGRVTGKTGTLSGVCSLSGYLLDEQTEEPVAVFSILMNGPVSTGTLRRLQDGIVEAMAAGLEVPR